MSGDGPPGSAPRWRHDGATSCLVGPPPWPHSPVGPERLTILVGRVCPHLGNKPWIPTTQGTSGSRLRTHLLLRKAVDDLRHLVLAACS